MNQLLLDVTGTVHPISYHVLEHVRRVKSKQTVQKKAKSLQDPTQTTSQKKKKGADGRANKTQDRVSRQETVYRQIIHVEGNKIISRSFS